jgi:hypothetical protein
MEYAARSRTEQERRLGVTQMSKTKNMARTAEDRVEQSPSMQNTALACLGPPPLIKGEDAKAYQLLLDKVVEVLKPTDIMGLIWARDVTDWQWDIMRLRNAKVDLIDDCISNCWESMAETFKATYFNEDEDENDAAGLPRPPTKIAIASGVRNAINDTDRIDRMLMRMEDRRNSAYRESQRHKEILAARGDKEICDAEYHVIEPDAVPEKKAA